MNKTLKIILIVLVGIVFVGSMLFLGYAFMFGKQRTNDNANTNTAPPVNQNTSGVDQGNQNTNAVVTSENQNTNSIANANTNTPPPAYQATEQEARKELASLANIFAEFYGSFSNQSNYQNVKTLYDYMTSSLQKQEEKKIAAASQDPPTEFYSVSTSAHASQITALDLAQKFATVVVNCQRVEEKGEKLESRKFQQDLVLQYVLEDNAWKVNLAAWGKEK